MKNINLLIICLSLLTLNKLSGSAIPHNKLWADDDEDEMDYSAPMIFDSSLPSIPTTPKTAPTAPPVEQPKIQPINKNIQPPKITPFKTAPQINHDHPPAYKILQKEPMPPAPQPPVTTQAHEPQDPTPVVPLKRSKHQFSQVVFVPRYVPFIPPQTVNSQTPYKKPHTTQQSTGIFSPVPYKQTDQIEYYPNYQIHNLKDSLTKVLDKVWQSTALNILFIEANGPLFVTTPLWTEFDKFHELVMGSNPNLRKRFESAIDKDQLRYWLSEKLKSLAIKPVIQTDPSIWTTMHQLNFRFLILPISDLRFSIRKVFLNDLKEMFFLPQDGTKKQADFFKVTDAGFDGGAFFRNPKANGYKNTIQYLFENYREQYPQLPLNFIHVHQFLNERDLAPLKTTYSGLNGYYGIHYQSIQLTPLDDLLSKVIDEESILTRIEKEFLDAD